MNINRDLNNDSDEFILHDIKKDIKSGNYKIDLKDSSGCTDLMAASNLGDFELLKQLIDLGSDINAVNDCQENALILAVYGAQNPESQDTKKFAQIVDYLCSKKIEINQQDFEKNTALMLACGYNDTAIIRKLICYHADTDLHDENKQTALMRACITNSIDSIYILCMTSASKNEVIKFKEQVASIDEPFIGSKYAKQILESIDINLTLESTLIVKPQDKNRNKI